MSELAIMLILSAFGVGVIVGMAITAFVIVIASGKDKR